MGGVDEIPLQRLHVLEHADKGQIVVPADGAADLELVDIKYDLGQLFQLLPDNADIVLLVLFLKFLNYDMSDHFLVPFSCS